MNLVWAVVKGDLLTSGCWFVAYFLVALGVAKWRARHAATTAPAWARSVLSPEQKFRLASMCRRRRTPLERPRKASGHRWTVRALYGRILADTRYRPDPGGA